MRRATVEFATPGCPECGQLLVYDHTEEWWSCPGCSYQTTIQSLVHRLHSHMRVAPPYRHYRKDGWPYCPQCDEDELWSNFSPATIDTIVACYRCGWEAPDA